MMVVSSTYLYEHTPHMRLLRIVGGSDLYRVSDADGLMKVLVPPGVRVGNAAVRARKACLSGYPHAAAMFAIGKEARASWFEGAVIVRTWLVIWVRWW